MKLFILGFLSCLALIFLIGFAIVKLMGKNMDDQTEAEQEKRRRNMADYGERDSYEKSLREKK